MSDSPLPEAFELPPWRRRRQQEPPRVAIIGAGPVGLEAALYAQRLGLKPLLFERENCVAPDVRAWGHVPMFTPWGANRSPLGEQALREAALSLPSASLHPTGAEFVEAYLEPLAKLLGNALMLETRVVGVGRSYLFPEDFADAPERRAMRRFRLLTRSPLEERVFTADAVLDAGGLSHTPNWAGVGGLPALGEMGSMSRIFYGIPDILGRDRIHFLGKRTLLIGSGASAATSATLLDEVLRLDPAGRALWAVKTPGDLPLSVRPDDPLPRRDLLVKKANLLIAQAQPGWEFFPRSQVEAIQYALSSGRFQITLQADRVTRRFSVDSVIANVGAKRGADTYESALRPTDEPGFYALGAKSSAPSDDFLLQSSFVQIRDAFRRIMEDAQLDLYAQAP